MAKETPRGVAGNAGHKDIPLRDWSMGSYNADTGRSHSSIAEYGGEAPLKGNYAGKCSAQIPTGFEKLDRQRTTDPRPVRTREGGLMPSKLPHRHPVVGTKHPDHPVHVHHHDEIMEREHSVRDRHTALAYHHSDDHHSCLLPKDGSHTQGNHASEYVHKHGLTREGETAKNRKADGRRAGDGY